MAITSLRIARSPSGRLFAAYVDGGALKLDRYNDAEPPVVADTISVVGSGVTSCSLGIQPDGRIDLVTTEGGAVKWRQSSDGGATFGAASTIDSSGWDQVGHLVDHSLFVIMVHSTEDPAPDPHPPWKSIAGVLNAAGSWVWSTPQDFSAGPTRQGSVRRDACGRWAWCETGDSQHTGNETDFSGYVWQARQLGSNGEWLSIGPNAETLLDGYWIWSTYHDAIIDSASGMLLMMALRYSDLQWVAMPFVLGTNYRGFTWIAQGAVDVVAATKAPGSLWRRADGTWEFAYVPAGTPSAYNIIRCRALAGDGTGTWA